MEMEIKKILEILSVTAFGPSENVKFPIWLGQKLQGLYTLFTNGRQPGTSAWPNMESRRFGINLQDHQRKQVKLCL